MILRKQWKQPGYDCLYSECQHTPKGKHGICSDRWAYAVVLSNFSRAVELVVSSTDFPDTIPASHFAGYDDKPAGMSLVFHERSVEDNPLGAAHQGFCRLVEHICVADSSALQAHELFERLGAPTFDQPEALWQEIEAMLVDESRWQRDEDDA